MQRLFRNRLTGPNPHVTFVSQLGLDLLPIYAVGTIRGARVSLMR